MVEGFILRVSIEQRCNDKRLEILNRLNEAEVYFEIYNAQDQSFFSHSEIVEVIHDHMEMVEGLCWELEIYNSWYGEGSGE